MHQHSTFPGPLWLLGGLTLMPIFAANAAVATWTSTTGSPAAWATPGNWTPSVIGGVAEGDEVIIQSDIGVAYTINLGAIRTMGKLTVGDVTNSSHGFTLAPSGGSITFDQTGADTALLGFTSGISNTISAPIALQSPLRVYATSTTPAIVQNLSGALSGSLPLRFDNDDGITPAGPSLTAGIFSLSSSTTSHSGGITIDDVRVAATNVASFGTGTVTVANGGQAWLNVGGTFANAFDLTGIGWTESSGNLGAIRMAPNAIIGGNVNITGAAGDSDGNAADASIFMPATDSNPANGTINGVISGGDFRFGVTGATSSSWSGPETLTLTNANTYGDTIVQPPDVPTSGQTTLVIGGSANTTATLGTGNVYLFGGTNGKLAALRIQRTNGYALTQDISSLGNTAKTAMLVDCQGTGLALNGHSITVGEQLRLGTNANNTSLTVNSGSQINAGQIFTGNAANNSSTVTQTGGAVAVTGEVRIANAATESSVWNMSGGTLTLSGTPTDNPYFTATTPPV